VRRFVIAFPTLRLFQLCGKFATCVRGGLGCDYGAEDIDVRAHEECVRGDAVDGGARGAVDSAEGS